MSRRLLEALNRFLIKEEDGWQKLAAALNVEEKTVRRWAKEGIQNKHKQYKLALACGCTEEEALALASEGLSEAKRA